MTQMINDTPLVDENGLFDIADDAILAAIAGGVSASAKVLDNHCTVNESKCGVQN